jgi:dTDP-4-dehydrorhamnose reductase
VQRIKSVLIIGASGFVGTRLALHLRDTCKVFATYHTRKPRIKGVTLLPLSIDSRDWCKRVAFTSQPDAIVYAAGKEDLFWAEKYPREADRLHTAGAATLSNVSDLLHPKFIYLSNGLVFDGAKGNYRESDTVLPSFALGKAKLGGENYIRGRSLNYLIVRSSPLLGRSTAQSAFQSSFLDRLRMELDRGRRVELSRGELYSYGSVEGLCEVVETLISSGIRNRIFHYGGLSKVSPYELGKAFAKRFGYDPELVVPGMSLGEAEGRETHVHDYSLNCSQVAETLKLKPLLLEQSFDLIQKQLVPGL